jgi:hypothetical protein
MFAMAAVEESTDESPLEVADALGQLAGGMSAIHLEVLSLVAVADRRGDWREDGATDMPAWLCQRFGLNRATACEWVRRRCGQRFYRRWRMRLAAHRSPGADH